MSRLRADPGPPTTGWTEAARESWLAAWLAARQARAMRRRLEVLDRELGRIERLLAREFGIDAIQPLLDAHAALMAERVALLAGLARLAPEVASKSLAK